MSKLGLNFVIVLNTDGQKSWLNDQSQTIKLVWDTNTLFWICFHFCLFCIELKLFITTNVIFLCSLTLWIIWFYIRNFWMKEVEPFIFVYSNFVAFPFTLSALFCLKILLPISISNVYLMCLTTSVLADFFSANFSKEIAKFVFESCYIPFSLTMLYWWTEKFQRQLNRLRQLHPLSKNTAIKVFYCS